VFANLTQLRAAGLVIGGGAFLVTQQERLAALATRHAVPAVGEYREFAAAGGLARHGTRLSRPYPLAGVYVARVLKGERPDDLPVQQSAKVELYINLKTAKALGITVPKFGISAKWLELLKEIAPEITRVAVIRDPTARSGLGEL